MNAMILLPALLSVHTVAASQNLPRQHASDNGLSVGFNEKPPWDIPSDQWPVLMASPDFEGEYAIDGFDISKEYPGEPMDGWTVSMSVKQIDADGVIDTETGKTIFVGSTLRLNPPEDLVKDAISDAGVFHPHPSWKISGYRYNLFRPENRTKLEDDDGSCTSLLTSECISAWEEQAGETWGSSKPVSSVEDCRLEYSAAERPIAYSYSRWQDDVIDSAAARNIDWYEGSEIQLLASEATGLDDEEMIARVGGFLDMVMITWGYNTSYFGEDDEPQTPTAKLVCTKGLYKLNNSEGSGAESENSDGNDENDGNDRNDNGVSRASQVSLAAVIIALAAALSTV